MCPVSLLNATFLTSWKEVGICYVYLSVCGVFILEALGFHCYSYQAGRGVCKI